MKLQHALDDNRRSFTGALFTTFVFNSDYFEGTLLPILRRKSLHGNTVVCIDSGAYQETTTDDGIQPTRAGKDYFLSSMQMPRGSFHPKVYFFGDDDRAVGFVGSANLTGAAFDQNQEVVTRFDVQNADDLSPTPDLHGLAGIRRFYTDLLAHPVAESMGAIARQKAQDVLDATDWVVNPDPLPEDRATTHVLDNLTEPLFEQLQSQIAERNETMQAAHVIAPFYGSRLAVPEALTDAGITTTLWLQQHGTQIPPDELRTWLDDHPLADVSLYDLNRYVHGKVLLIKSSEAVYCLAGSSNASRPALLEAVDGEGGFANVEVAVLRRIPQKDHYDYLLDRLASNEFEGDLDSFQPRITDNYQPSEDEHEHTVELLSVNFTQSEVFDGGRLHGRIKVQNPITDSDELQISVKPTSGTDSLTISFTGANLESPEDASSEIYSFSRRITKDQEIASLSVSARVTPQLNGTAGSVRWMAIESRDVDREAAAAAEDDGVNAVWRTVLDVFVGSEEIRTDRVEFLGQLASQLSDSRGQRNQTPDDDPIDENTDDGLSGGISLPSYSGSTSTRDPASQYANYYETFIAQIHNLRNSLWSSEIDREQVLTLTGSRLAELNRMSTLLEITKQELEQQGKCLDEFPENLTRDNTRRLYSQQEPGFGAENTSVTAQFVDDAVHILETEDERVLLQEQVGTNIIFGRLVAETFIAKDDDTFNDYYGQDFDTLIEDCLRPSSGISLLSSEELTAALWDHFDELPEMLRSASFSRRPPREFHDQSQLRHYIRSLLHSDSIAYDS